MASRLERVGRTVGVVAGAVAWVQGQPGAPLSSLGSSPTKMTAAHGPTCRIIHVHCACSAGLLVQQPVFARPVQLEVCCVYPSLGISTTDSEMLHSFKRLALASLKTAVTESASCSPSLEQR